MLLDVFEYGGAEGDFAGEGRDERVLGDHCLQIADPVSQPGPGGAGEHEEQAREDRVPLEPGRAGGGGPAAADGLGFVLEKAGVVDQFYGKAFAAHGGAVDLYERAQLPPVFAVGDGVVHDGVGDEPFPLRG